MWVGAVAKLSYSYLAITRLATYSNCKWAIAKLDEGQDGNVQNVNNTKHH